MQIGLPTPARKAVVRASAALAVWLAPLAALAEEAEPELSAGDTAWIMTSSAVVMMMTLPGLALFYGGLVRSQERAQRS